MTRDIKAGYEGSQLPGRKQGVLRVSSNVYLMDSAWFLAGCRFCSFKVHAVGSFSYIHSDIENYLEGTKVWRLHDIMTLMGTKKDVQSIPLPGYWNFKPCWNLNHLHVSATASPLPAWKRLEPFTQPCSWVQRFPRLGPLTSKPMVHLEWDCS